MDILFKHIWIFLIAVTIINGLVLKYRARKYIAQDPELATGYDQFVKGWLIFANIPWVIMMIGNLSGITQHAFEYFKPREMNPMVLLFHFAIIVLWFLSARWIYLKDGAAFIEKHPGLIRRSSWGSQKYATAKQIKLILPIMLLGGIVGMIMMWVKDMPGTP